MRYCGSPTTARRVPGVIPTGRRGGPDPASTLAPALGAVIRRRRLAAQMPQEQLAERAGVSRDAVVKVEQGRPPRLGVLEAVAGGLGVATSVLVIEAEELLAKGDG